MKQYNLENNFSIFIDTSSEDISVVITGSNRGTSVFNLSIEAMVVIMYELGFDINEDDLVYYENYVEDDAGETWSQLKAMPIREFVDTKLKEEDAKAIASQLLSEMVYYFDFGHIYNK